MDPSDSISNPDDRELPVCTAASPLVASYTRLRSSRVWRISSACGLPPLPTSTPSGTISLMLREKMADLCLRRFSCGDSCWKKRPKMFVDLCWVFFLGGVGGAFLSFEPLLVVVWFSFVDFAYRNKHLRVKTICPFEKFTPV